MAMPRRLILVRHGESVGNQVHDMERRGYKDVYSAQFCEQPAHLWRLTERGVAQAKIAGQWLRENMDVGAIEGFFTSDYTRAKETAGHLGIPGALWKKHPYLHERSWGLLENLSDEQKWESYEKDMQQREVNPFYWRPPRGESMVNVLMRSDRVFGTLHREYSESTVIMVEHGDVAMSQIILLEKMSAYRYEQLRRTKDSLDKINNCQIIIYSRENPETGELEPYLNWKFSICPWNPELSRNIWQQIERPVFTNEELLADAELSPLLVHSPCYQLALA